MSLHSLRCTVLLKYMTISIYHYQHSRIFYRYLIGLVVNQLKVWRQAFQIHWTKSNEDQTKDMHRVCGSICGIP